MPIPPIYNWVVKHGPMVHAKIALNDVPFYQEKPKNHDGTSGLASHLLIPGKNTFRIDVLQQGAGEPGNYVALMITKDVDPKADTVTVVESHFPGVWAGIPEEEKVIPYSFLGEFEIDEDHPKPPWDGVAPENVPGEGTDEMRMVVQDTIEKFRSGAAADFVDGMGARLDDMARYYPPTDGISRGALTKKYQVTLARRWEVLAFDPEVTRFEPRQSGRLIYVSRTDGHRVLTGRNLEDPLENIATDLVLMRKGGTLRVMR